MNSNINFGYTIVETLPILEGINHILNLPIAKRNKNFSRKHVLAELAKTNTDCVCCKSKGVKFCLGRDKAGGLHWDLYTKDDIALSIDHIIPKSEKGLNHISNTQIMCIKCNSLKENIPERLIPLKYLIDAGLKVESFHSKNSYLRIGYWRQIPFDLFQEVSNYLIEEEFLDDDCGALYCYYYKI